MTKIRGIGLAVLAIGIVILILGYNASQTVGEEVVQEVTGNYTDETIAYIIIGVVAVAVGGGMVLMGGPSGSKPTA